MTNISAFAVLFMLIMQPLAMAYVDEQGELQPAEERLAAVEGKSHRFHPLSRHQKLKFFKCWKALPKVMGCAMDLVGIPDPYVRQDCCNALSDIMDKCSFLPISKIVPSFLLNLCNAGQTPPSYD